MVSEECADRILRIEQNFLEEKETVPTNSETINMPQNLLMYLSPIAQLVPRITRFGAGGQRFESG